jgi:predicted DNA-binding transcriptional regulator YafY
VTRTERLTGILLLLQSARNGRRYTAADIAEQFGVSRRTILRDIAAMGELGIPVEATEGASGGYSLPADFRLAPLPLTLREVTLLLVALDALRRLSDAPYGDTRDSLTAKLRGMLAAPQVREADALLDRLSLDVPDRSQHPAPFLDLLVDAARRGIWVHARYRAEHGPADYTLLPRRLYAASGFWYCTAHAHERDGQLRHFRADRFESVTLTTPPPGAKIVEPTDYNDPAHPEIIAQFTSNAVTRAEREPHVGHALHLHDDGSAELRFRCPPSELDWWARWFFAFGPDADVLAPPELRQRLRELAQKIVERYPEQ